MSTFISCNYNEKLNTSYKLANRSCEPCKMVAPFSFGFAEEICSLCASFEEVNDQADPIQQYTFREACGAEEPIDPTDPDPVDPIGPVDPVDPIKPVDPTEPIDPNENGSNQENGGDEVTPGEGNGEEEKGFIGSISIVTWIIVICLIAIFTVGGYCAYQFWKRKRANMRIRNQLATDMTSGDGNKSSKSKSKKQPR